MPHYKLTIEYDGTPFVGWQMQENGVSVQGRLAEAIKAFSGEDVTSRGAGRTDAGVHARGQVCHADVDPAGWGKVRDRSGRSPEDAAVLNERGATKAGVGVAYDPNSTYGVYWVLLLDD